jgi:steroid delta-isomerase-like uncharacterized protein
VGHQLTSVSAAEQHPNEQPSTWSREIMTPSEIVDCFFEQVWNQRKLELLDSLVAADCVTHQTRSADGPLQSAVRGPAALREHIALWLSAFSDMHVTVDERLAQDARVISWVTMRGTHTGAWQRIPPTGRGITIRMATMHRVENGRIAEDWVIVESLGLYQQLGLVAPTAQLLPAATT